MTVRDNLKSETYFNIFLDEEMARIDKFTSKLENNEVREGQILPVQIKLHNLKLGVFIARYSKGAKVENLIPLYSSLIDSWSAVWSPDTYVKNLWLFSLGKLLNCDDTQKQCMINMLEQSGVDDLLFNFILGRKNSSKSCLIHPEIYSELYKAIDSSPDKATLYIKEYVSNIWYRAHKDCGWYDSHKSNQNLYTGYWSFEAAAVAKILGVNDFDMDSIPFYPYDLAHFDNGANR